MDLPTNLDVSKFENTPTGENESNGEIYTMTKNESYHQKTTTHQKKMNL